MSTHREHVELVAEYARRVCQERGRAARVSTHGETREAVEGADAVILTFDVGGLEAARLDHEIPASFGVGQCIGDTLGPGAVLRAQRTIPVVRSLCRDLRETAPGALVVNYVNPLGPVGMSLLEEGWRNQVGLCQGPAELVASVQTLLGEGPLEVRLAGTNHLSWLIDLRRPGDGVSLYPRLKERLLSPDIAGKERARGELLQTFGYFCSESSGQLSDLVPWFRNSPESRSAYLGVGYAGETGAYPRLRRFLHRHLGDMGFFTQAELEEKPEHLRSLSRLVRALGAEFSAEDPPGSTTFGNVPNAEGRIAELRGDSIVETPIVKGGGLWVPRDRLAIPPEVFCLTRRHDEMNRLMTRAGFTGDPDDLLRALCMDPLCSAVLGIGRIRELTNRLLESQAAWLPQYRRRVCLGAVDFATLPQVTETPLDGVSVVDRVRHLSSSRGPSPTERR